MTLSANLAVSTNTAGGKELATHRMPSNGNLARAGEAGHVEIWGLGRWLTTDHPNWMLDESHWFVRLESR